jgi:hypothetical protein
VRRHGANVHLTLHRLRIATVFTRHSGFSAVARGCARGNRPRPTAPGRSFPGKSCTGDSADGPNSQIRGHSASKSSAPHTPWIFWASAVRAQGADPWCSPRYTGEAGCDRLLEAHTRGRPKDRCLPQAHAPEPPRAWNHPHNGQALQPRATSPQPLTPPTAPQLG